MKLFKQRLVASVVAALLLISYSLPLAARDDEKKPADEKQSEKAEQAKTAKTAKKATKELEDELKPLWQKVKDDPPFAKPPVKDKTRTYSERLRDREELKRRGFWLSSWYQALWQFGSLGYVVAMHFVSGNVAASMASEPGDRYEYSFGQTRGTYSGRVGLISVAPYLYMKTNQLVFGSILLFSDPHPALAFPLLSLTRMSMYHLFTGNFIELVAGIGDMRRFSEVSGVPYALLFVGSFVDLLVNLVWLGDSYEKAWQRSLYRKKKVSFQSGFTPDGYLASLTYSY